MEPRNVVNVSKVYGKGTVHIPRFVREDLHLKDGDILIWAVEQGTRAVFTKAEIRGVKP